MGSYGEVWLARNVLGALRAVKILYRARLRSDRPYEREFSGIQRFEPISRSHDGLVDVLHVGRDDTAGFFYYVMELADSTAVPVNDPILTEAGYAPRTLASDLESRGALPVRECVPLFLSLAGALAHLHNAGLVHRDIKPANIIFVGGRAKLADIGLVTSEGAAETYVGTEGFIPPEGPGTRQSDIYSLGKVIYEAATGYDRLRFPSLPIGLNDIADRQELLELNAIILKACATDPAQRYQSAEELQADLALLQSGKSIRRLRTMELRLARARGIFVALIGVALVAGLISALATFQARVERENRERSDRFRQRAERAEQRANEELWRSRMAEARAVRRSGFAGRRTEALQALIHASRVRVDAELLSEAVAVTRESPPEREVFYETLFPTVRWQIRANEIHTQIVKQLACDYPGVELVDTQPALNGHSDLFIDVMHFTPEGEQQMAEVMFAAVKRRTANGLRTRSE